MLLRRVVLTAASGAAAASLAAAHARRAHMAPVAVAPLASLAAAPLLPLPSSGGAPAVAAGSLWADKACVIMAVRRPGCQLCRAEAAKLHLIKPQLDAAAVRLVAVLNEDLPEQVAAFAKDFWPGELYLDQEKAFFAAVGGGTVRRGTLLTFLNPFSRVWANAKAAKGVEGNFEGDGLTYGGLLVVRPRSGAVEYAFQEETFGDHAPHEDVLAAALRAAAA